MRTEQELVRETLHWSTRFDGRTHDARVKVVYDPSVLRPGVQLHYYGGMGVEERLTGHAVRNLGKGNLPAVGVILIFHDFPATPANIERVLIEAPVHVAEELNDRAGNSIAAPVDLSGDSQGGGAVVMAATHAPERFGAIAASKPIGFNSNALGVTPKDKRLKFLDRLLIRNAGEKDQSLLELGNLLALQEISTRALKDLLGGRFNDKLDYALGLDLTNLPKKFTPLSHLVQTHPVAVFGGETDPVFPYGEIQDTLGAAGIEHILYKMLGSHTNPASRGGAAQMGRVGVWFHQVRAKRAKESLLI